MNTDFATNYTKTLAGYFVNLRYEDIPAEVLERAIADPACIGGFPCGFEDKDGWGCGDDCRKYERRSGRGCNHLV